ncbi:MAG: hypothetical protein Q8N17_01355 [Burkholderiaceae bacterium]|nr:hypothetical protein [Burkholderiaceae bacterium]
MSDAKNPGFGQFVPGFDFLKNLTQGAAAQDAMKLPQLSQWMAPTLSVEDLDKRIEELKAVQFWLDQNATALKATIQALEVQKMTLATLKGMNFDMSDMARAFMPKGDAKTRVDASAPAAPTGAATGPAAGAVDPMQWWGALTQQFQQIASSAMQQAAARAAPGAAEADPAGAGASAGAPSAAAGGTSRKAAPRKSAPRKAGGL